MTVTHSETHFLPEKHPMCKWLIEECGRAAALYNRVNYLKRQAFTGHHDLIPEYTDLIKKEKYLLPYDIITKMRQLNDESYRAMHKSSMAGQIVIMCDQNWNAWFRALSDYRKNPGKCRGKPRMPKYLDKAENGGTFMLIYDIRDARLQKDGTINIERKKKLPIRTRLKAFNQLHVVPVQGGVNIILIYEKEIPDEKLDNSRVLGIDLGVENLAAVTSNAEPISLLVNGRPLKSINQFYDKKKARLQSKLAQRKLKTSKRLRQLEAKHKHKIKDYMHKASRRLVDLMKEHNLGLCAVGHNFGWKNKVNMGKRNNQNFTKIPHSRFIEMLRYKAEEVGAEVVEINESYTSKCSFLDGEKICRHDEYMGKRVRRSLYRSAKGIALNADINGSLNIVRRVTGSAFRVGNEVFQPRKIDIESKNPLSLSSAVISGRGTRLVPSSVTDDATKAKSISSVLKTAV